jgi:cation-transporting P-type ATPase E
VTEGLTGLTAAQAEEKRRAGLGNAVKFENSRSYGKIVFDNTISAVNVTLFGISIVLAVIGLVGDAVLTVSIVAGNVVVGIFQETRAKRQLDRIALLTRPRASVLRDREELDCDPNEIVQGDLLIVRPGDQVQADGKVINEEGLSIDEALLTGESDLVSKDAGDEVFAGTFVMQGTGVYEAVSVGTTSVAHQITTKARTYKVLKTPLQREIGLVIWVLAGIALVLGVATVISFQRLYGELPLEETTRASAVIVAIIPQGLWFMVTITYAMAIVRLARSGALIQTMNAVESLSHVDVLSLDKTGTLTTNRLHLEKVQPIGGASEADVTKCLGVFAASASFSNRTNEAILEKVPSQAVKPVEEVTFDSSRKWSAIVGDVAPLDGLATSCAPTPKRRCRSSPRAASSLRSSRATTLIRCWRWRSRPASRRTRRSCPAASSTSCRSPSTRASSTRLRSSAASRRVTRSSCWQRYRPKGTTSQ